MAPTPCTPKSLALEKIIEEARKKEGKKEINVDKEKYKDTRKE